MATLKLALPLLALPLLAACGGQPDRLVVPPAPIAAESTPQRAAFATVELRDVSLPLHAQEAEVFIQEEDGFIRPQKGLTWADDPIRKATMDLADALSAMTTATVAAEPWPFENYPAARMEVRFTEFVASRADQAFHARGQYFVSDMGGYGRDRSGRIDVNVPLPEDFGPTEIARATAAALGEVAREISTRGLR